MSWLGVRGTMFNNMHIQTPAGGSMIVPIYFPTTMRATPSTPVAVAGSGTASGSGGLTLEQLGGLNSQGAFFQYLLVLIVTIK